MPSMKSLSLTVQQLSRRLKLTTDKQTNKQTGQKQYAPDHSVRGHKKLPLKFFWPFIIAKQYRLIFT